MEELKIYDGETIDTAVERLLEAKAEGKHVFCVFNGVKLYSDNVTWTEEECEAILKILQDNEEHSTDLSFANGVAESKEEVTARQKRLVRNQSKGQL